MSGQVDERMFDLVAVYHANSPGSTGSPPPRDESPTPLFSALTGEENRWYSLANPIEPVLRKQVGM
jgi:hypothetical protein